MVNLVNPKSYSPLQVSKELGVDRHTVRNWINRGWMIASKFPNGRFRISEEEFKRIKDLYEATSSKSIES